MSITHYYHGADWGSSHDWIVFDAFACASGPGIFSAGWIGDAPLWTGVGQLDAQRLMPTGNAACAYAAEFQPRMDLSQATVDQPHDLSIAYASATTMTGEHVTMETTAYYADGDPALLPEDWQG